ncbi:MAG: hypothetical protein OXF74_08470 [Rhodobacteraceae bacterium]|nr:hypothetical protein [Paracoccaceae bacterium]
MAAMAACMFNPEMAEFHKRLRERGKCHKVAVTAVMRKLIVTANALLRDRRMWEDRTPPDARTEVVRPDGSRMWADCGKPRNQSEKTNNGVDRQHGCSRGTPTAHAASAEPRPSLTARRQRRTGSIRTLTPTSEGGKRHERSGPVSDNTTGQGKNLHGVLLFRCFVTTNLWRTPPDPAGIFIR